MNNVIGNADIFGNTAVWCKQFNLRTGGSQILGRGRSVLAACVIKDQELSIGSHFSRQNIPYRTGEFLGTLDGRIVGQTAGCNDHDVGLEPEDIVTIGKPIEPEFNSKRDTSIVSPSFEDVTAPRVEPTVWIVRGDVPVSAHEPTLSNRWCGVLKYRVSRIM